MDVLTDRELLEHGEAVAWALYMNGALKQVTCDKHDAEVFWPSIGGVVVVPLYTAPPSTAEAQARALVEFAMELKQLSQRTSGLFSEGLLHAATYAGSEAKRIREEG